MKKVVEKIGEDGIHQSVKRDKGIRGGSEHLRNT